MTYSKEIIKVLKSKDLKEGDRIVVGDYEGLLMPSPEITSSPKHLILKLDNGYNIGIKYKPGMKIEKSATPEPQEIEDEYIYETREKHVEKLKEATRKAPVSLLAVGGTIASKVDYHTGAVNATLTAKDLIAQVPELTEIAFIRMKTISETMSEDMDNEIWKLMAKEAAKELNHGAEGVVITHGTDTMHYSSAALSFMLKEPPKPVIFTGAQRSSDRGSADSAMNLICSVHTAKSQIAEVGVCMHASVNDDYCYFLRGTKVRKMSTSMRSAFKPINDYPLAKVWPSGRIQLTNRRLRFRRKGKVKSDTKFEPKVALLKAYPGSEPKLIDFLVKQGFKGIVVEGTGLGHVPTLAKKSWIPSITKAIDRGVPVVVASQPLYGRVNLSVYSNLRTLYYEVGAIPAEDMLPETAYVKLGWVLGHTKSLKKVREMMLENYVNEINPRLQTGMFMYK